VSVACEGLRYVRNASSIIGLKATMNKRIHTLITFRVIKKKKKRGKKEKRKKTGKRKRKTSINRIFHRDGRRRDIKPRVLFYLLAISVVSFEPFIRSN